MLPPIWHDPVRRGSIGSRKPASLAAFCAVSSTVPARTTIAPATGSIPRHPGNASAKEPRRQDGNSRRPASRSCYHLRHHRLTVAMADSERLRYLRNRSWPQQSERQIATRRAGVRAMGDAFGASPVKHASGSSAARSSERTPISGNFQFRFDGRFNPHRPVPRSPTRRCRCDSTSRYSKNDELLLGHERPFWVKGEISPSGCFVPIAVRTPQSGRSGVGRIADWQLWVPITSTFKCQLSSCRVKYDRNHSPFLHGLSGQTKFSGAGSASFGHQFAQRRANHRPEADIRASLLKAQISRSSAAAKCALNRGDCGRERCGRGKPRAPRVLAQQRARAEPTSCGQGAKAPDNFDATVARVNERIIETSRRWCREAILRVPRGQQHCSRMRPSRSRDCSTSRCRWSRAAISASAAVSAYGMRPQPPPR